MLRPRRTERSAPAAAQRAIRLAQLRTLDTRHLGGLVSPRVCAFLAGTFDERLRESVRLVAEVLNERERQT